jgi:dTDP-glucose 4,6-dehydratase
MPKTVLITGGCGFIGSNLSKYLLDHTDYNIIIVDKLSYSTKGFERVKDLPKDRVQIYTWDLVIPITCGLSRLFGDVNIILHLAAESHVDNSITNAPEFIHNNVMSTVQILEYAKTLENLDYFFLFSTDETYGNLEVDGVLYTEESRHSPRNPYSASKSSAEMICLSYANTYDIPLMSVNCMNVYGKMQHVEKFIPKVIDMLLKDETISIHSYPDKITAGSRFYIHVDDVARAVLFIMKNGKMGECYNIAGQIELDNLSLAKMIAGCMDKELKYEMLVHDENRKGHDLRYGLDGTKLANLGFHIEANFRENLREIVDWTLENLEWLEE